MNVLAIGNSFSEDATTYLHTLAASAGVDLQTVNLYIGGCSLETHADNLAHDRAAYRYDLNGEYTDRPATIRETLCERAWDIVTIQQASPLSGLLETYSPHAESLLAAIREYAPTAKIYFHQTWSYEIDTPNPGFANYGHTQQTMYEALVDASERFAAAHGLGLISCGRVIQTLRREPVFDYPAGGESLCRDGSHISIPYGRYALAATWLETLTGTDCRNATFVPDGADSARLALIAAHVHRHCTNSL